MLSKTKMCAVKSAQEAIYITHEFSKQSNNMPDFSYPGLPSSSLNFVCYYMFRHLLMMVFMIEIQKSNFATTHMIFKIF